MEQKKENLKSRDDSVRRKVKDVENGSKSIRVKSY